MIQQTPNVTPRGLISEHSIVHAALKTCRHEGIRAGMTDQKTFTKQNCTNTLTPSLLQAVSFVFICKLNDLKFEF